MKTKRHRQRVVPTAHHALPYATPQLLSVAQPRIGYQRAAWSVTPRRQEKKRNSRPVMSLATIYINCSYVTYPTQ